LSDELLAGIFICLEQGANDVRMIQLSHCHPIISSFIKIQIGLTFLVLAYAGCPVFSGALNPTHFTWKRGH